jgi:hypothetical protein
MFAFSLDAPKCVVFETLEAALPLALVELVWAYTAAYGSERDRLRLMAVDLALQLEDSLCTGLPDNTSHGLDLARFFELHPEEEALVTAGENQDENGTGATLFHRRNPDPYCHTKLVGFVGVTQQFVAHELSKLWSERSPAGPRILSVDKIQLYVQYGDPDYDIWAFVDHDYRFLCHLNRTSWSWGVTIKQRPCACGLDE